MRNKTIAELRALARAQGIKGYSRMAKEELIRALSKIARAARKPKPAAAVKRERPRAAPPAAAAEARAPGEPPAAWSHPATDEERIEDAKFVLGPSRDVLAGTELVNHLHEDIERLPALPGPALSLLPQKPGILHAYWALAPGTLAGQPGLRLRLSRVTESVLEVLDEVGLPAERGSWYFHVDEALDGTEVYLQLGRYRDGEFVTALRHAAVRLPRLYASTRADRRWWVSEEDFRRLYLRAGGRLLRGRLTWPGGPGSPSRNLGSR